MVKKRVPDWLNSSLWSSIPPPDDDRLHRYASKSTTTTTTTTTDSSSSSSASTITAPVPPEVDPPVPVPPPSAAAERGPVPNRGTAEESRYGKEEVNGASSGAPSVEDISRQAQLLAELSKKVINMRELRRIASQGIPDGAGIRSTVWKLLLGYLPPDRSLWSTELAKKRSQYKHFKDDLLMNPSDITRRLEKSSSYDNDESSYESRCLLSRSQITHGEHPLSLGKTSIWNQFFQDTEIIEQIDRDVKRTHPDMHFFSGDSQFAKSNQDALKNILMVFAKLNPGIRYVQGMNEILAPLYYVFKNDPEEENAACAEADTFFCFVELLSGFRDNFCQQLDNSVVGIRSTITKLSQLLKEHDEELWRHLEVTTKVNPQFYAFRWITLLLTQEFNFADSLHIWDTLLSDPEGPQETLLRVCCAMLILIRRRLLAGDFTSNLKLLQNYPPTNISHLLYVANKLRIQPSV
ncbi:Rab-GTPase-TBC domain containing protein [Parasponia andersonii]|uniref:Rab-GTPase-TBC domain containing protein n=1 Tax=Parasponia andersonii TaxID=3476 RepID=A0A2P5A875_PARAD|nr:Rab-GTPase-TBC domain containing protein [Parasponia andersonii]